MEVMTKDRLIIMVIYYIFQQLPIVEYSAFNYFFLS